MSTVFRIYSETVGATTPLASYQKALKCLLETGGPYYLIVDGLDECSQEDITFAKRLKRGQALCESFGSQPRGGMDRFKPSLWGYDYSNQPREHL